VLAVVLLANTSRHQQLGGLMASAPALGDEEEVLLTSCCSYLGVMLENQRLQEARLSQMALISAQERASRLLQVIHATMSTPLSGSLNDNPGEEKGKEAAKNKDADARDDWIRTESQEAVAKIAWCLEAEACRLFLLGRHRAMQGPYLEWTASPRELERNSSSTGAEAAVGTDCERGGSAGSNSGQIRTPSTPGDIDSECGMELDMELDTATDDILRVPLRDAGIAGLVARKAVTVNLAGNAVGRHASYKHSVDSLGVDREDDRKDAQDAATTRPAVYSLIAMPIFSRGSGNVLAVLQVVNKKTGDKAFSQLDEALLSSCGYYIGANLHNVRLRQQLAQSEAVSNELLLEMLPPHVMRQLKGQIHTRRMSHKMKRFRYVTFRFNYPHHPYHQTTLQAPIVANRETCNQATKQQAQPLHRQPLHLEI
jgi:hypothetical protein